MQVSVENTGPLERKIRVEVPEEKIAGEVQSRLQSMTRTTRIQGFRPGKAPLKVVEQRFGGRVRQEVVGEVVQTSFFEALAREKLRPAGQPVIDPMNAEQGQGLQYTATFEIYPEVKLAKVADLQIEKPVCQIAEPDVDQMLEVIRKQRRTLQAVDRAAREGDILTVDFSGSVDGAKFEGGEGHGVKVEIGSKRFIPGFEEGLKGATSGGKVSLDLQFPEKYHATALAGKPVRFEITISVVEQSVLPELDDTFFATMGVKEGGLSAFKAEVRRNMEREAERALSQRSKNIALQALYAANRIELPKTLIKNEAMRLSHQFHMGLQMRGIDVEHHHDEAAETAAFTVQAEKKVTLQLLIGEIVRTQQIKAEPAQVRQMIEQVAHSYEDPNEVVNWYHGDPKRMAEVEALALEEEVVKWLLGQARVTEKQFSFDDLMNNGQTETV